MSKSKTKAPKPAPATETTARQLVEYYLMLAERVSKDPNELEDHPNQPRTKPHSTQELIALGSSMSTNGQRTPAIITHNGTVVSGHGRKYAAKKYGLSLICDVLPADTPESVIITLLDDNVQRISLDEYDIMIMCTRLKNDGYTGKQVVLEVLPHLDPVENTTENGKQCLRLTEELDADPDNVEKRQNLAHALGEYHKGYVNTLIKIGRNKDARNYFHSLHRGHDLEGKKLPYTPNKTDIVAIIDGKKTIDTLQKDNQAASLEREKNKTLKTAKAARLEYQPRSSALLTYRAWLNCQVGISQDTIETLDSNLVEYEIAQGKRKK